MNSDLSPPARVSPRTLRTLESPHINTDFVYCHFSSVIMLLTQQYFHVVHPIGPKRHKNLVSHFVEHGLVPRRHGNPKRLLANTVPFAKTECVVAFIKHFFAIHALPLPGRIPGQYSDEKALLLPSNMSKRYVYWQYCHACEENGGDTCMAVKV